MVEVVTVSNDSFGNLLTKIRGRELNAQEINAPLRIRNDSVDRRVGRKSAGIAVDRLEIGIVDGNEKERFKNERPTVHVRLTTTASDIDTIMQ
ncbi:MAG: hypothetical protein ACK5TC_02535 [bacterium]|jgi:hypothetical protein